MYDLPMSTEELQLQLAKQLLFEALEFVQPELRERISEFLNIRVEFQNEPVDIAIVAARRTMSELER